MFGPTQRAKDRWKFRRVLLQPSERQQRQEPFGRPRLLACGRVLIGMLVMKL
ncbi:hypothetical protein GHO25_24785 [Pseudomonas sp. FSL R10-1350]|nr:hypothetical protein [Pseudomonas sp. FSL R10-1350]